MSMGRLLERWIALTGMSAIVLTALAYPLYLEQELLISFFSGLARFGPESLRFFETNVRPVVQFGYDPLVLKESAGAMAALCMFVGYLPWKLLYAPRRQERAGLHLPLILFLALAAASLLWTPSFRISLQTLEALLPAAVFFLMVSDLDWGERGRRRLLWLLVAVGAILCIAATCQILPWLRDGFHRFFWRFDDPRNFFGSLIGHNTGMSAWALSSFLAGLGLFISARRTTARVFLACHLALSLFVIIATQSRATWPLALILGGWGAYRMARAMGRPFRARHALIAAAMLIGLALPQWERVSNRLKDFGAGALMRETRLRILIVSLPGVAEAPLFGHGVGSFMHIYPKLQADYFAAHPDSRLGHTDKRTPQAHNDYLQVLLEMGLAGLVLLGVGIVNYAREGRRGWFTLRSRRDQAQSLAFGLIALQFALHAFVDFPAHIPPLAYLFAFSLGVWVGLGREARQTVPPEPRVAPRSVLLRVAILVVCLLPLAFAPLAWARIARESIVATHGQVGRGYLANLGANPNLRGPERAHLLNDAEKRLMAAFRLEPGHWEILMNLARIHLDTGRGFASAYRQTLAADGPATETLMLRAGAERNLRRAIHNIETSFEELKYHENLLLAGQAYVELERLDPDGGYRTEILRNLGQAIRYSNTYYDALAAMARYISAGRRMPDPNQLISLHQRMREAQPERYANEYLIPAKRHNYLLEFERAAAALGPAVETNPDLPDFRFDLIRALSEAGRMDQAELELLRHERDFGQDRDYWAALVRLRILQGRLDEALELALTHGAKADPPDAWMAMAASLLLEAKGEVAEAEGLWAVALAGAPGEALSRYERAYLAWARLDNPDLAMKDIRWLTEKTPCPAPMAFYLRGRIALERGDVPQAIEDARRAIAAESDSLRARALLSEAERQAAPQSRDAEGDSRDSTTEHAKTGE